MRQDPPPLCRFDHCQHALEKHAGGQRCVVYWCSCKKYEAPSPQEFKITSTRNAELVARAGVIHSFTAPVVKFLRTDKGRGSTAPEIAYALRAKKQRDARDALVALKDLGLVRKGPRRLCRRDGGAMITWWAIEIEDEAVTPEHT